MYGLEGILRPSKEIIQVALEKLNDLERKNLDDFLKKIDHHSNEPAWQRYAGAFIGFPKTWWIGIFQMQMVAGLWGEDHRIAATIRQNSMQAIFNQIISRPSEAYEILRAVAIHIAKYRKSDLAGRLSGATFTNYALTGGRAGKTLPIKLKIAAAATNFTIASYGGLTWAVGTGINNLSDIFNSIIIGRPSAFASQKTPSERQLSDDEARVFNIFWVEIHIMMSLNQIQSDAIPLSVFCSKPENVELKMCK